MQGRQGRQSEGTRVELARGECEWGTLEQAAQGGCEALPECLV